MVVAVTVVVAAVKVLRLSCSCCRILLHVFTSAKQNHSAGCNIQSKSSRCKKWVIFSSACNNETIAIVYQVATGSGKPVILAVNFAEPLSDVSTFCSGVTTTGGFTAATAITSIFAKLRTDLMRFLMFYSVKSRFRYLSSPSKITSTEVTRQ